MSLWTLVLWQMCDWQPDVDPLHQVPSVHVTKTYFTIGVGSVQHHQKGSGPWPTLYSDPLPVPGALVLK